MAWRALGQPPGAATAPPSPAPSTATTGGPAGNPWRVLRRRGLRIEPGLQIFGTGAVRLQFEPPVQLNNTTLYLYRNLRIGRYSYLRSGTVRHVGSIGRYTSIGPGALLGEAEHPTTWLSTSPAVFYADRYKFYPPEADADDRVVLRTDDNVDPTTRRLVTIGNDVWIGANVMVRRGVTIGDGAIVGSGAFVNRDVRPYSIVAGLPAKEIGSRFDDETVQRLIALRWWEFDVSDLAGVDFSDVHAAIAAIQSREASGAAQRIPLRYSSVRLRNDGFDALTADATDRARATRRLQRGRALQ